MSDLIKTNYEEMFRLYMDVVAPGTNISPSEFKVYVEYCNKRGFDPLAKDIYIVKRWDAKNRREIMGFQSSIDAIRKRGVGHPDYEGQSGPFWCGEDGVWKDVWLAKTAPKAAKVGIWRKNFKEPLFAVALFDEYVQKTKEGSITKFWLNMPSNQLAKCAESLAWRKSFPESFDGVYFKEEMEQADNDHVAQPEPIQLTDDQKEIQDWRAHVIKIFQQESSPFYKNNNKATAYILEKTGKALKDLNAVELEELLFIFQKEFFDDHDAIHEPSKEPSKEPEQLEILEKNKSEVLKRIKGEMKL